MRTLDLNLLRVFDAVMLERNVTRAAAALYMTQPAVSNAINRLRESLDDPLFIKIHGGVAPTPRAQSIWPPIKQALRQIDATVDADEFDPATGHAIYRIAASDYVADYLVRPLMSDLSACAPFVELHFRPHRIKDAVPLLEKGEIDFAAGVLSNFNEHIRAVPLDTLHYVGMIRRDHPLGATPSAEEFLAAPHIVVSLSGGPALVDIELAERGLKRRIALIVNQYGSVDRMVAETDMVSIVPTRVVLDSAYGDRLGMVQLPFNVEPRVMSLVWHERSDDSPEHRWLRERLLRRPDAAAAASGSCSGFAPPRE